MLTGENGILTQAFNAANKTNEATEKEKIEIAIASATINTITDENLKKSLEDEFGENKTESKVFGDKSITVLVKESKNEYNMDNNGNITVNKATLVDDDIGINGEGTEENPYLIESIEDLLTLSKETTNYVGKNVKLSRTLDFKSISSYINYKRTDYGDINGDEKTQSLMDELTSGQGFPSIVEFHGVFDGNGNEIRNLYINSLSNAGIFTSTDKNATYETNITVKNLGVTGIVKSQNKHAGGIIGKKERGEAKIINCYNKATIISKGERDASHYGAGGLVGCGKLGVSVSIINSYNLGDIIRDSNETTEKNYSGGLIGGCGWDAYAYITKIVNSYNLGRINNSDNYYLYGSVSTSYDGIRTVENSYYLTSTKTGKDGIALEIEQMKNIYLVNLLNDWVKTNNQDSSDYYINDGNEGHIEYKEWILGEDGYPTFKGN